MTSVTSQPADKWQVDLFRFSEPEWQAGWLEMSNMFIEVE